jgi:WD40 repeat protein
MAPDAHALPGSSAAHAKHGAAKDGHTKTATHGKDVTHAKGAAHAKGVAHTNAAPTLGPISSQTVERVKSLWQAAVGGFGKAVAIDRARNRVAVASGESVHLFDLWTGKPAGQPHTCANIIRGGLAFHRASLVVVCENAVERYDVGTLKKLTPVKVSSSRITAVAFAPSRMALGHYDGVVRIYALAGGAPVEIPVPGPPIDVKSLALTDDGKKIAVAWIQGSIWWWQTDVPTAPNALVRHSNESDTLAFNHAGTLLAEEGEPKQTTIWSFAGSQPSERAKLRNGEWVKRLHFTNDDKWLIRGTSDGLEIVEIDGPRRVALDTTAPVEDVAVDAAGTMLGAVDRTGRFTMWSVR